jgi:hypothetical protein
VFDMRSNVFGGLSSAGDLLARNARIYGRETSLIYEFRSWTWEKTNARANRFANSLQKMGIKRGDRVAIYAKNSHRWVEALFGLAKIGVVVVTVNYRLTAEEAGYIADNCDARAVICDYSTVENALIIGGNVDFVINFEGYEEYVTEFFEKLVLTMSLQCCFTQAVRLVFRKVRFIHTGLCSSGCWFTFWRLGRTGRIG